MFCDKGMSEIIPFVDGVYLCCLVCGFPRCILVQYHLILATIRDEILSSLRCLGSCFYVKSSNSGYGAIYYLIISSWGWFSQIFSWHNHTIIDALLSGPNKYCNLLATPFCIISSISLDLHRQFGDAGSLSHEARETFLSAIVSDGLSQYSGLFNFNWQIYRWINNTFFFFSFLIYQDVQNGQIKVTENA